MTKSLKRYLLVLNMIRVAIVDDDRLYQSQVKDYIEAYSKESGIEFSVTLYNSGMDFITDYKPVYDIAFLDIEMPLIDGMTTARKLRQTDSEICIVFITKMAKYAIEGYEVNAVDFVVKPIKYFNFKDKLKKAIKYVEARSANDIIIKSDGSYFRIPVTQIYYIEKDKNYIVYNTAQGELRERRNMEDMAELLEGSGFSMCNSGCIVNLRFIQQVTQTDVTVNGVQLPLSRRRIKDFKTDMLKFLRG